VSDDAAAEAPKPIVVSGEQVRAFGSRLTALMTIVGAFGMLVVVWPVWSSPWLRGQALHWLLFGIFAWLASTAAAMFAWFRLRGLPPTSFLLALVMSLSTGPATFATVRARSRLDRREQGLASELVWPSVLRLREHPSSSDDEVRGLWAHDDQRPVRLYRRTDVDGRAAFVVGASSLDGEGSLLVAPYASTGLTLAWTRAKNEAEARATVQTILGDDALGDRR
jgi:hypothetical protein